MSRRTTRRRPAASSRPSCAFISKSSARSPPGRHQPTRRCPRTKVGLCFRTDTSSSSSSSTSRSPRRSRLSARMSPHKGTRSPNCCPYCAGRRDCRNSKSLPCTRRLSSSPTCASSRSRSTARLRTPSCSLETSSSSNRCRCRRRRRPPTPTPQQVPQMLSPTSRCCASPSSSSTSRTASTCMCIGCRRSIRTGRASARRTERSRLPWISGGRMIR
mmetsp:Transcript_36569/g.85422  ORF Transcript_36569/g.85422 Transcript_36569/m.85422 type:complete len:216 (+) Transcript_36569:2016-2663(+)